MTQGFKYQAYDEFGELETKWVSFRSIESPKGLLAYTCAMQCYRCKRDTPAMGLATLPGSKYLSDDEGYAKDLAIGTSVSHTWQIPNEAASALAKTHGYFKLVQCQGLPYPVYSNHCLYCGVRIDDLQLHYRNGPFSLEGFGSLVRAHNELYAVGKAISPADGLSEVLKVFWLKAPGVVRSALGALDCHAFDDFEIRPVEVQ